MPINILDKINKMFFKFIWGKRDSNRKAFEKVKRETMYNGYENGGLNMIDIKALQKSFLLSWANKLLSNEEEKWKEPVKEIFKYIGGLRVFECNTCSQNFSGANKIRSSFWSYVLELWMDRKPKITNRNIALADPVFNNSNITLRGNTLFSEKMIARGIFYVKDFFVHNRLKTSQEIRNQYGSYNGLDIDFNAVKIALNNKEIETSFNHSTGFNIKINTEKNVRKEYYNEIKAKREPSHVERFWNQKGANFDQTYWEIPFKSTSEVRLRVLQWKIIHNIYPTKILLQKMKISDSNKCTICEEIEYSEHFFYHCKQIKDLWKEIESIIRNRTKQNINLTMIDVMLGIRSHDRMTKSDMRWANEIILVCKMVISKYKYGSYKFPLELLINELEMRKLKER